MQKDEYRVLYETEDDYWWYKGLRDLAAPRIEAITRGNKEVKFLDAGCGTGGVLQRCWVNRSFGFDISDDALKFCKLRNVNNVARASILRIPFKDNAFDVAVSYDVLCNMQHNEDISGFEELYRVLKIGGRLLLNLPAYEVLQCEHDRAVNSLHRYTKKELTKKMKDAGFTIERMTYRNTILFPFIALKRLSERFFSKKNEIPRSELAPLSKLVNNILTGILFLENKIVSKLNLPFGLSLFCIARKD